MNESPFIALRNSVWFESYFFVKFVILSPDFCHTNKVFRQALDNLAEVSLDFCILPIELASWNFACAFLITFPRTKNFWFFDYRKISCICTVFPVFGLRNIHFMHRTPRFLDNGPVLVNDVQTPSLQKEPFSIFGPKWHAMFWNEWKINFPIFSFWNMVDFRSSRYTLNICFFHCPKRCALFWIGFLGTSVFFV